VLAAVAVASAETAMLPSYLNRRDALDLARLATPVALSRMSFMLMGLTDAVVLARISFKTMAGAVIFLVLVANFPVGPALIGFCSVLLALSVRAFASLGVTARTSTPEPG
jgi:Na+-driven multidrug efflux pump